MKINKIEKLTDEKWLNLYAVDFENRGHAGRWVYASRQPQPVAKRRADAVVVVPVLKATGKKPRLVLIKEYRIPVGDWIYAFPAGLMEDGETPATCARRELMEETGLRVTRVKTRSPRLFSTAGLSDECAQMVFVDVAEVEGGKPSLDGSEMLEVVLLDYAGVRRLCEDTKAMFDAKVWLALMMYRALGRLE